MTGITHFTLHQKFTVIAQGPANLSPLSLLRRRAMLAEFPSNGMICYLTVAVVSLLSTVVIYKVPVQKLLKQPSPVLSSICFWHNPSAKGNAYRCIICVIKTAPLDMTADQVFLWFSKPATFLHQAVLLPALHHQHHLSSQCPYPLHSLLPALPATAQVAAAPALRFAIWTCSASACMLFRGFEHRLQ